MFFICILLFFKKNHKNILNNFKLFFILNFYNQIRFFYFLFHNFTFLYKYISLLLLMIFSIHKKLNRIYIINFAKFGFKIIF